jgi:hypothetical protein
MLSAGVFLMPVCLGVSRCFVADAYRVSFFRAALKTLSAGPT